MCTIRLFKFAQFEPGLWFSHLKYACQKVKKITLFSNLSTPTDGQTDRQTDTIHTSFSLTQPISREHNSPSGNKMLKKLHLMFRWPETCCFFLLTDDSVQERWSQYWCLETILWGKSKRDSGFCCFFCRSQRGIKDCIILKSSRILLFLLQESKRDRRLHYSEKFLDFVVSSAICKTQRWIKDCIILKSSRILFFLLQESKRDKKTTLFWKSFRILLFFCRSQTAIKRLQYSEKFPDFVLSCNSSAGFKRDKKLHYSEKFPDLIQVEREK